MLFIYSITFLAFVVSLLALYRAFADQRYYRQCVQRFKQQLEQANKILQRRGDLANEVAHEIKNPLTAILCSADALDLLIGEKIDKDLRLSLQYIREYGDSLLRMLSDFIDLSRAESGTIISNPQQVNLVELSQSIVGLLKSMALKKHINLELVISPEQTFKAWVDPLHYKQIVFNLLYNALKFCPEKSQVQVVISSEFPHPLISIAVKDNGPGIPSDRLGNIFDLYSRYDNGQENADVGAGLGLALCRHLVELSGSKLEVESVVGLGTTFKFKLKENKEPAIVESKPNLDQQPLLGQKFLVVDASNGSRDSVSKLIQAWGGVVDQVDQATQALQALNANSYDAIMLDSSLALDGSELSDKIRSSSSTLIVTSAQKEQDLQTTKDLDADVVINKPFNAQGLLESLLSSTKTLRH